MFLEYVARGVKIDMVSGPGGPSKVHSSPIRMDSGQQYLRSPGGRGASDVEFWDEARERERARLGCYIITDKEGQISNMNK